MLPKTLEIFLSVFGHTLAHGRSFFNAPMKKILCDYSARARMPFTMNGSGLLYRHAGFYRLMMEVLYKGRYRERFEDVCGQIHAEDRTVLELCFGDVLVAEYCRRRNVCWIGIDLSGPFVARAVRRGFDARQADLLCENSLPSCDLCVMMGSLYHFGQDPGRLFRRIKRVSRRLVISEPVVNWMQAGGVKRFLARTLTGVGGREVPFRFTVGSLLQALEGLSREVGFTYRVISTARDMVVEVVWSN